VLDVLDGDPAPPTESGTAAYTFRPTLHVLARSSISAAAKHLFPMGRWNCRSGQCRSGQQRWP